VKRLLIGFARSFAKKRVNQASFVFLCLALILHYFSIGWMAESRAIEAIMNGRPGSLPMMALVMGFILLRVTALLLLPGFLLSWIVMEFFEFMRRKNKV